MNSDIEKNKESKKLIKQIDSNIEEYIKYIEIIDKKFKNYESQNKIDENKKIEFEEEDLKILKEEIKNFFDLNKKYFLNYINSISKIEPIEKLKENKTTFEKSCNETINLIRKYYDINRFCYEFNKIKESFKFYEKCFLNYICSISKIETIEKLKENKTTFEKSCNKTINLMKKFDDINRFCYEFNEIKESFKFYEKCFFNYINSISKIEPIEKLKENKTKIYEKETLKTQVYKILKFIDDIETENSERLLKYVTQTLDTVNESIKKGQNKIRKNPQIKLNKPRSLEVFLGRMLDHINTLFKKYINSTVHIYNSDDVNSLYEESL